MAAVKRSSPSRVGARRGRTGRRRAAARSTAGVFLINMIPKSLSNEQSQDSEPHLTINPANRQQIVGTAFTADPAGGALAPIYISNDGGASWQLNSIVPSVAGSIGTADITTAFSGKATTLYANILNAGTTHLQFLRTKNPFQPTPMAILADRADADQPFTHARTNGTRELVYVGDNDFSGAAGRTATIDKSPNAGGSAPAFTSVRVEKRTTLGQDGPQTRPTSHRDGTVYAAFYRWRAGTGNFQSNTFVVTSADVVVVRDDAFGSGANPFTALVDPADHLPGIRVAQGVSFPFMVHGTAASGQQRLGGSISIAVDSRKSDVVYLVWGDRQPNSVLTLHVRASTNRGATWTPDRLTISNATNAAIAVADSGVVGLLYQQIRSTGGAQRWQTHLRRSRDLVNWSDLVLADVPATFPVKTFDPYLGDYDHLVADGNDLCGIFSTSNVPDKTHFPNGVAYQRNADFTSRRLLGLDNVTAVEPSIDPFFFRVKA
jgi:hypothetical protein